MDSPANDTRRGVLLITGAGRGIGAATAVLAAAAGYDVAVNYRRSRVDADGVVAAIERNGGRAAAIAGDVAIEADVVRMFDMTEARLGPIVGLVNNAGITGRSGRLDVLTVENLTEVMQINVVGSFLCAREAVRRMSSVHGGCGGVIVNISSGAATLGSPGEFIHYAASKAAIDTLTIGLGREVAMEGIRVVAVAPGMVLTDIHESSGDPGRVGRITPSVPMQRVGDPDEIASTILFLLSDAASYITSSVLRVAGGR